MSARRHVVAQTQPPSLMRIDYLARQDQFTCALFTNYQRQQHRSHRWKYAELDLRLTKTRALRSDNDIACGDQFTATAERRSVDERNRRFCNLFQLTKDRVKRVEHLENRVLDVLLDCDSRAKRATTLVRIKHDGDQVSPRTLAQRARDLAHHLDVEDIQRRPSKRNSPDAIFKTEADVLI